MSLLTEVDRAMGTLSGPATVCVLRRQRDVFGVARFDPLGSISVTHLYNLRASAGYRTQRVVLTKTRRDKAAPIGVRKAPAPEGRPGFIRIDSINQGDHDGIKGLHHINAVDGVTQRQVVATLQTISEAQLLPMIEQRLAHFPFNPESWASTPTTAARTSTTGSRRCSASCASSSRAAVRAAATTTAWPGPGTVRWCARSSATSTSRNATRGASTRSVRSSSTRC